MNPLIIQMSESRPAASKSTDESIQSIFRHLSGKLETLKATYAFNEVEYQLEIEQLKKQLKPETNVSESLLHRSATVSVHWDLWACV